MRPKLDWGILIEGHDSVEGIRYCDALLHARESGKPDPTYTGYSERHYAPTIDDDGLRRAFYRALLEIKWLSPAVRRAVAREAGISLQKRNKDAEMGRTVVLRHYINERKAQMRAAKLRPHGGIHEAAVEEIARQEGMTVAALKRRLVRLPERFK